MGKVIEGSFGLAEGQTEISSRSEMRYECDSMTLNPNSWYDLEKANLLFLNSFLASLKTCPY